MMPIDFKPTATCYTWEDIHVKPLWQKLLYMCEPIIL